MKQDVTCLNKIKWKFLSLFLCLCGSLQSERQYGGLIGLLKHPRASAEVKVHLHLVWHRQSLAKRFYSLKMRNKGSIVFLLLHTGNQGREKSMVYSKFAFCLKPASHRERTGSVPELLLKTFATKLFSYLKTLLLQKMINCFSGGLAAKHTGSMEK